MKVVTTLDHSWITATWITATGSQPQQARGTAVKDRVGLDCRGTARGTLGTPGRWPDLQALRAQARTTIRQQRYLLPRSRRAGSVGSPDAICEGPDGRLADPALFKPPCPRGSEAFRQPAHACRQRLRRAPRAQWQPAGTIGLGAPAPLVCCAPGAVMRHDIPVWTHGSRSTAGARNGRSRLIEAG